MYEKKTSDKQLEAEAEKQLGMAKKELEDRPPPEESPPIKVFDPAKKDVSPPLRFVPKNRVEDPENLSAEQITNIPVGTVLFRDIAAGVGRRMYVKLPSGLYYTQLT